MKKFCIEIAIALVLALGLHEIGYQAKAAQKPAPMPGTPNITSGPPLPPGLTWRTGVDEPILIVRPASRIEIHDKTPDSTVICYKGQCRRLAELFPSFSSTGYVFTSPTIK